VKLYFADEVLKKKKDEQMCVNVFNDKRWGQIGHENVNFSKFNVLEIPQNV